MQRIFPQREVNHETIVRWASGLANYLSELIRLGKVQLNMKVFYNTPCLLKLKIVELLSFQLLWLGSLDANTVK